MAARKRCTREMALNSGRLATRGIYVPLEGGESQIAQWVLFLAIWDSPPSRTYYTCHQASRVQCHFELGTSPGALREYNAFWSPF